MWEQFVEDWERAKTMNEYIICYYDNQNNRVWEYAHGENTMNTRVDELVEHFDCHVDEIRIFKLSDDLNLTN